MKRHYTILATPKDGSSDNLTSFVTYADSAKAAMEKAKAGWTATRDDADDFSFVVLSGPQLAQALIGLINGSLETLMEEADVSSSRDLEVGQFVVKMDDDSGIMIRAKDEEDAIKKLRQRGDLSPDDKATSVNFLGLVTAFRNGLRVTFPQEGYEQVHTQNEDVANSRMEAAIRALFAGADEA